MSSTTHRKLVRLFTVAALGAATAVFGELPCEAGGFGSVRVPTPQVPQIRMGGGFHGGRPIVTSPPMFPQPRFGSPHLGHSPTYVPPSPMGGHRPPFFPQPTPHFQPYVPGMGSGSPGHMANPHQPLYSRGYHPKPPSVSIHDLQREGGNAGGVASDAGTAVFQGFFRGATNGQGGGQNTIHQDEGGVGSGGEDESADVPAEVTGSFLRPGQISRPQFKTPRVRLPW